MRGPSARMRPTLVDLHKHTWGKDADRGRVSTGTTEILGVPCSAFPGEAMFEFNENTKRWDTLVPWKLHFTTDPGLSPFDEVTIRDGTRTHKLVVQGTVPQSMRGVSYVVTAIERI